MRKSRKLHGLVRNRLGVPLARISTKEIVCTATLRRVRVSSEMSSGRTLATPLTRTASAKTLGLSRPFATTKPRVMNGFAKQG